MTQKYYAIVTSQGAAKIANAAALGTKLNITHMAVGDGGGTLPTPNASQTKLVNEVRLAAINTLSVDPANANQVIAEQVIPENEGGFWIREMGLFDAAGTLIAVCNTPETYKPALQEGSGRTQTVRMILIVNSTDAITLKIDPSVVLATRQYADSKVSQAVIEVRQYADDLMANHLAAADPHKQYAPKESPVFTGTPKAPTPDAGNNSALLPARFQEAGSQMIDGLMAGISQKWDAIKNKLSSLTDYLPDFLKPGGDKPGAPQLPRPATVKAGSGVSLPPGGFPGFAGMYDSGGFIPSGQFGVAGENGPELVSGPANVTSRRSTARLAALAALTLGGAGATAEAKPLHPLSLPVQAYRQEAPRMSGIATQGAAPQIHASFTIVQQPGQSQQDLVDEVMRRLKAEQSKAEARERSSYRDRGGFDE